MSTSLYIIVIYLHWSFLEVVAIELLSGKCERAESDSEDEEEDEEEERLEGQSHGAPGAMGMWNLLDSSLRDWREERCNVTSSSRHVTYSSGRELWLTSHFRLNGWQLLSEQCPLVCPEQPDVHRGAPDPTKHVCSSSSFCLGLHPGPALPANGPQTERETDEITCELTSPEQLSFRAQCKVEISSRWGTQ